MRRIFTIAYLTFLECVRNKVLLVLFVFVMIGIGCSNFFSYMSPSEEIKLLKDFSLGAITFIGIIISIFLPISVISLEIEKLTVYSVLSKPVRRGEFIVAKYLGVLLTLLAMLIVMGAIFAVMLFIREGALDTEVMKSIFLLFFKFAIVSALSVFFNIITTSHVSAILISFLFYVLGHLIDYIEDLVEHIGFEPSKIILTYAAKLLPNLGSYDVSDAIVVGTTISRVLIAKLILYSVIYSSVMLFLAILCFRKRDL